MNNFSILTYIGVNAQVTDKKCVSSLFVNLSMYTIVIIIYRSACNDIIIQIIIIHIIAACINYGGKMFYESRGKNRWLMRFIAVKDLNALSKVNNMLFYTCDDVNHFITWYSIVCIGTSSTS